MANIIPGANDPFPPGIFLVPLCATVEGVADIIRVLDSYAKNSAGYNEFLNALQYVANPLDNECVQAIVPECPECPECPDIWCVTFDFLLQQYVWTKTASEPYGTWVNGAGWSVQNTGQGYQALNIYKTFAQRTVLGVSVRYRLTPGNPNAMQAQFYFDSGVYALNDVNTGVFWSDREVVWSGATLASQITLRLANHATGQGSIRRVTIWGEGSNPF